MSWRTNLEIMSRTSVFALLCFVSGLDGELKSIHGELDETPSIQASKVYWNSLRFVENFHLLATYYYYFFVPDIFWKNGFFRNLMFREKVVCLTPKKPKNIGGKPEKKFNIRFENIGENPKFFAPCHKFLWVYQKYRG